MVLKHKPRSSARLDGLRDVEAKAPEPKKTGIHGLYDDEVESIEWNEATSAKKTGVHGLSGSDAKNTHMGTGAAAKKTGIHGLGGGVAKPTQKKTASQQNVIKKSGIHGLGMVAGKPAMKKAQPLKQNKYRKTGVHTIADYMARAAPHGQEHGAAKTALTTNRDDADESLYDGDFVKDGAEEDDTDEDEPDDTDEDEPDHKKMKKNKQ